MPTPSEQALLAENAELRARLEEAEETLRAIRCGEIDALVVETPTGSKIFTLQGQDAELNRFRGEILAQINDAVIVVDDDQRVTYLNASAAEQYGITVSEALGRRVTEIFQCRWLHPGDEASMRVSLDQTGQWRGESVHVKRNGEAIHVELSMTRLRTDSDNHSGLLAVIRDITERKQAEEEMKQTLILLDTLLRTAPIGFAFLDRELNYIRVNDRLAEMNGIPAEAHIGRHLSEIVPMLVKDLQEVVDRILKTGRPICNHRVFGETAAAPGLKRYWSESWYPMFDQGGEIIGFGAVVEDITDGVLAERSILENEQRMRMATEATGVGIWEWDLITDKIRWDKQMFRIYGIAPTPDRTVDYSTWKLAVLPEDLPLQEKVLQDTISRTGRSTREFRILRAKDKQCRYIQGTETVRVNAQGQAEWMVGTNLDITERKQAEQALKEADRRKDEFLAMLAHELRNPLGPIRNVAQLLKMDGLDEKRISWCGDVVDRQVKHLSQLVDDLLDISRITLGKIELKKEPLAVADYVLPAVETTRPIIEARQQVLSMTLPPQPLRVEGDRVRLTQVVTNLLSNAAKYTGQGGHIGLTVEQQEDKMCIRVSDTGCGIDASELPRLFDLFYQVDGDIARSQGGLGIGLSLVYRLVMMHGGDIQAFSAGKGQGSEFVVRLPLLSSPDTVKSAVQTYPPSMNRGLDILIVDDSCAAAESLAMLLELQGHRVWMAHDGISAVETALVKHPQVVILDIGLPVMDGYAVARKLRQSPELGEMLIIALSGYAPPNDPEVLRATGFDEYLVKPVDMEKLQRLFRKSQELV